MRQRTALVGRWPPKTVALALLGLACCALGAVLLIAPPTETTTLANAVGVGLVLLGADSLLRATSSSRPTLERFGAACWILAGISALLWPHMTIRGLAIWAGGVLVITSLVDLAGALLPGPDRHILPVVGALTGVALGVAALAWPSATALVVGVVVALRLLIAGTLLCIRTLNSRNRYGTPPPRPRWPVGVRVAGGLAALALAGTGAAVSVMVHRSQPGEPGPFYNAPDRLGPPGALIRSEEIEPFAPRSTAFRVLYVTSDAHRSPTTSSGLVIVPDGRPPPGGRPVVAFTHGTIGIARRCAPSLLSAQAYAPAIPGLEQFLAAGFVVVATDFAGLGSLATNGYLVGTSEAYSTLDSVRSAQQVEPADASSRFVVFGESQGGHAALFTGLYANSYAPDLDLIGVAAAAPATDLTTLFKANTGSTFGDVLAAYALDSWSRTYDKADLATVVDPQARPVVRRLSEQCLQTPGQMLAVVPEASMLKTRFFSQPPWEVEPWVSILADNTPSGRIDAPVLIAQGEEDPLVLPAVQKAFFEKWCRTGQPIDYRSYPGVGHLDAGHAAAGDVVEWAKAMTAGAPPSPTCN